MGRPKKLSYHAGVLHGINLTARMNDIAFFSILQKIHDEEIYKKELGYDSWRDFCTEEIGISKDTLDRRFAALKDLGPELTKNFANLGLKWKDIRLLEQALTEGQLDNLKKKNVLSVEGRDIPFDDDHKSDIQGALDVLKEKLALALKAEKLSERKVEGIEKEHKKEIKFYTDEIEELRSQLPSDAEDSGWAEKLIEAIDKAHSTFDLALRTLAFHKQTLSDPVIQSKLIGKNEEVLARFKQFQIDFENHIAKELE